jgi:hypothetical protein
VLNVKFFLVNYVCFCKRIDIWLGFAA